jgi:hypothetical protein
MVSPAVLLGRLHTAIQAWYAAAIKSGARRPQGRLVLTGSVAENAGGIFRRPIYRSNDVCFYEFSTTETNYNNEQYFARIAVQAEKLRGTYLHKPRSLYL